MNDAPRDSLKKIVKQYGEAICDTPRRCEALLRDYCGEYRREIFVLITALEQGVAGDLRRAKSTSPTAQLPMGVLIPRLAQELHETTALSAEAAQWGVQAWADALDIAAQTTQTTPPISTVPATAPRVKSAASRCRLVHQVTAHTGEVSDLAFSPDGHQLASVGMDAAAHIWDVASCEEVASLTQQTGILTGTAWHPDGLTLALSSGDWGIYLWHWLDQGSEMPRLRGHRGSVTRVVFTGDGTLVSAGRDGLIHLWNTDRSAIQTTLRGHADAILDLALSPDGRTLASAGGWDRTVRIWDLPQAKELMSLTGHTAQVTCVSFGAGNAAVATGSWDETARIWDLKRKSELARFTHDEETVRPISTLDIGPDGNLLATGDWQSSVCLWQIQTRTLIDTLSHHRGHVRKVAFDPQGEWLASADGEGTLCLWRIE